VAALVVLALVGCSSTTTASGSNELLTAEGVVARFPNAEQLSLLSGVSLTGVHADTVAGPGTAHGSEVSPAPSEANGDDGNDDAVPDPAPPVGSPGALECLDRYDKLQATLPDADSVLATAFDEQGNALVVAVSFFDGSKAARRYAKAFDELQAFCAAQENPTNLSLLATPEPSVVDGGRAASYVYPDGTRSDSTSVVVGNTIVTASCTHSVDQPSHDAAVLEAVVSTLRS